MKIITGVSGSIGKLLFEHYNNSDEPIVGTFNRNNPLFSSNSGSRVFQVDISDYEQVSEFIAEIEDELKNICLINCASIVYDSFAHKADPDSWKHVIDVNLTGTFNMIRALLPYMRDQEYGRIINFSSVVAQTGAIGTSAYAASKAALWGLTKSLTIENANKNILINSINLGYMESGMTDRIPKELKTSILEKIPLKSFGPINEVILAAEYLINTDYIAGTTIDVNGGLY